MTSSGALQCAFCRLWLILHQNRRVCSFRVSRVSQHVLPANGSRYLSKYTSCLYKESKINDVSKSDDSSATSETSSGSESNSELDAEPNLAVEDAVSHQSMQQAELASSEKSLSFLESLHATEQTHKPSDASKYEDMAVALESNVKGKTTETPEDQQMVEKLKMHGVQKVKVEHEKPEMKVKKSLDDVVELSKALSSIDKSLLSAAKTVAKSFPGNVDETESKLIGQLLNQFQNSTNQKMGHSPKKSESTQLKEKTLGEVMQGMAILKEQKNVVDTEQDDRRLGRSRGDRQRQLPKDVDDESVQGIYFRQPGIGLFKGQPLRIFEKKLTTESHAENKTLFEIVAEEERLRLQFYLPANAFDEQIQWAKEDKLWTFPIDNEAGWEDEKCVGFQEHVFLETRLADFPKKGPIRHFMELITTALSKNPYLRIQQKYEHIDWYKNYFREKQDVLESRLGNDGLIISSNTAPT